MDIRCRKTDCKYNELLACKADKIDITDNINCASYEKVPGKARDISKQIFESTPEIADYVHNKKMCLECKADCLFNKDKECIANGITVNDIKDKPLCITFCRK